MAPLREPGLGLAVALGTSALHSPLLLWISYLLPDPPPPPLTLLLLHLSSVKAIKAKGGKSPMAFLVMNRTHRPGEGRGAGRRGCIGFFLHEERLTDPSGEGHGLYKDGHWTRGILRSRKSPWPYPGSHHLYKNILRQRGEISVWRASPPCLRPADQTLKLTPRQAAPLACLSALLCLPRAVRRVFKQSQYGGTLWRETKDLSRTVL